MRMLRTVVFLSTLVVCQVAGLQSNDVIEGPACNLRGYHAGQGNGTIARVPAGESVILECRPGYYFERRLDPHDYDYGDGDDDDDKVTPYIFDTKPRSLYCQIDGRWDQPVPTCHAFSCPRPRVPRYGGIVPDRGVYQANEMVTFVCSRERQLIGYSSTICDLSWNGWTYGSKTPICREMRCPRPTYPINGWVSNRFNRVGTLIEYGCNSGYELYGSFNQTCLSNGEWSGVTPICRAVAAPRGSCDNPVSPSGSRVDIDSVRIGSTVHTTCYDEESRIGPAKSVCGPLGWSPISEPKCVDKYSFNDPDVLARTFASIVERFSSKPGEATALSERRYDLFFLIDSSHSVPPDHFKFAKKFVENLIDQLTLTPAGTAIGLATFATNAERDFTAGGGLHAIPGTSKAVLFRKLHQLKHLDGDTNITGAFDFVHKVMFPSAVNARRNQLDPDVPKVIFLFSDGDVTHGGHPKYSAERLKKIGVEIFTIQIGTEKDSKTREVLQGVSSEANFPQDYPHFLRIQNASVLNYMLTNYQRFSTVDGKVPAYPQCGKAGDVDITQSYQVGGDTVNSTTWPWIVAINKVKGKEADFVCTGTLLSNIWVMTASKCVGGFFDSLIVKAATSKDKFDREIVKRIFRHPDGFPNDVALLLLSHPLRMGPYVRPACLPDYSQTLQDRFGDYAMTFGWNGTQLRQAAVEIIQEEAKEGGKRCRGDAPGAGYCAGHNSSVTRSCKQDVGGPLVIRANIDRQTRAAPWVVIGMAWQENGCTTTGGNNGRFNSIERYLPWIKQVIVSKGY